MLENFGPLISKKDLPAGIKPADKSFLKDKKAHLLFSFQKSLCTFFIWHLIFHTLKFHLPAAESMQFRPSRSKAFDGDMDQLRKYTSFHP